MKYAFLMSLVLLGACASGSKEPTETLEPAPFSIIEFNPCRKDAAPVFSGDGFRIVPLSTAKIQLNNHTFNIGAVDSISLVLESDYYEYKKGERVTIHFGQGCQGASTWMRIESPKDSGN